VSIPPLLPDGGASAELNRAPQVSRGERAEVVVLDYGFGNVRSAVRALERVGARVELTADRDRAIEADGLVVPGVGAFAACMAGLRAVRGDQVVERRLAGGRPVLGICVGMQVMFRHGVEHGVDTEGLGEWDGVVERLDAPVVPHMGWSTVEAPAGSRLFAGIEDERFYFVHSYAAQRFTQGHDDAADPRFTPPLVTWATHHTRFVAAVEDGPLAATQFHPEKSGDAGATLLENWVKSL
jgi:glutamine amidotransferase